MIDSVGNVRYYETLNRWRLHTDAQIEFYDKKLEQHQASVRRMQQYHAVKNQEQHDIYEYHLQQLKIAKIAKGSVVDVYA